MHKMAGTAIETLNLSFRLSLSPPSSIISPLHLHSHSHFPKTNLHLSSTFNPNSFHKPSLLSSQYQLYLSPPIAAASSSSSSSFDPEVNDGESKGYGVMLKWGQPLLNFASNNFLPLALIGGITVGFANPSLGCVADRYYLSKVSTFSIFIISGLTLRSQEIVDAVEAWPVGVFGLASILLLTPALSRLVMQLTLVPQEFVTGLAIFCCMPTTLSSGVSLTQLAGGNFALALAMTVISNLLGILVVPFTLSKLVASGVGISIPTMQLFKSLTMTLLVPLILGKVFRESVKDVASFADKNRKFLSIMSALFLSFAPWIQVSKSRSLLLMVSPSSFLLAIGLGMLLHIVLLAFNALAIKILSSVSGGGQSVFSDGRNVTALLLVASQKTLPVMVAVVDQLGGALGATGLLVLPCVAAHLNQIFFDSFLVNSLLRKDHPIYTAKVA